MRTQKILSVVILTLMLLSVQTPALACTVFAAVGPNAEVLTGNNEDWLDKDTYVWFLPASPGKYGRVCYGFETAHPQGGMNEKGLFFDWFASGSQAAPQPAGKPLYPGDLNDALLEQCANVDDALALYGRYHDPNLGYATMLLADAAGNVATVSWDWQAGQPNVVRSTSGLAIGVGEDRISACLPTLPVTKKDFAYQLLQSSSQTTLYSTISNLRTGEVTLYNRHLYDQSFDFRLGDELDKGAHIYYIPALFPNQPRGTGDPLTPWALRGTANSIIYIGSMAMFGLAALAWGWALWRRRHQRGMRLFPLAGLLAGAVLAVALGALNDKVFFVLNYGAALYGPWLPALMVLATVLFLGFAGTTIASWVRRRFRRWVLVLASVYALLGAGASLWLAIVYAAVK